LYSALILATLINPSSGSIVGLYPGRATISWMFGSIGSVGVGIANGEYYNNNRIK